MPSAYLDFEVEVGHHIEQAHPIVVRSPAGQARHSARFPLTDAELESHLLKLENAILRSAGRRRKNPTPEDAAVQGFGQRLFDFLFSGEALSLYRECHRVAAAQGKGVRLKLNLQPPSLAVLPWEFLYDPRHPGDYTCLDPNTPLVRFTELPQTAPPLTVTPPLRILGVVADPTDLPRLAVAEEKDRLHTALAGLAAQGLAQLTWLEGQTALDLQRTLRRGPWHALHFIGHAGFDTQRDEGLLMLTSERGQADPLYATQLGRLLATQRSSLRLVLLNACEGARGSTHDLFASTAATLIGGGIPAVLAMQYEITDGAALQFARTFYEALADNLPVDAAVADARNAIILRDRHSLEWGTPVLHMRAVDGVLFDLAAVAGQGDKERGRGGDKETRGQGDKVTHAPEEVASSDANGGGTAAAKPDELPVTPPTATPSTVTPPLPANWLTSLRSVLANLYPDENSTRRLLFDAAINTSRITFSGKAVDNWHAILSEVNKTGQLADLLAVALGDYGEHPPLRDVMAALGMGELLKGTQETRPQTWNLPPLQGKDSRIVSNEAAGVPAEQSTKAASAIPELTSTKPSQSPQSQSDTVVVQPAGEVQSQANPTRSAEPKPAPATKKTRRQTSTATTQPPTPASLPLAFDWVTIPAGEFWLGSRKEATKPASKPGLLDRLFGVTTPAPTPVADVTTPADLQASDDEMPQHKVILPAYRIARTPVTVAQFAEFIKATQYQTTAEKQGSAWGYNAENKWAEIKGANWAHPRGPDSDVAQKANHPVTCVSWYDAVEFCKWATAIYAAAGQKLTIRLPSEAEWEKAARGTDGRIWPWGNTAPTDKHCNFSGKVGDTTPVGNYQPGASPYGVLDMAGNVWEWTNTLYKGYPYQADDGREDAKASGSRTLRGGSWLNLDQVVRCAYRGGNVPDLRNDDVGFRVVSPGS